MLLTDTDKFNFEQSGFLKSRKWPYDVNQIARVIKANNAANTVYSYYFTWAGGGDPNLENFRKEKTAVNIGIGTAFLLNPNPSVIPLPSRPYLPGATTTVFHLLAGNTGFSAYSIS